MSNFCLDYCSDPIGTHTTNESCETQTGPGQDIVFIHCGAEIDNAFDPVQVNAALDAGLATMVKDVKITIPKPSVVTTESNKACNNVPVFVRYDFTLNLIDTHVNPNNVNAFYSPLLKGRKFQGLLIRDCGSPHSRWVDETVSFTGGNVLPDNDEEHIIDIDAAWRSKNQIILDITPAGVFD